MKEFFHFELKNGIRIIYKQTSSNVAHCGFVINAGSRDENISENGIAHFIEHTLFKGTKKRKAYHILNRIDSVGGEINAYTTKEKTCIYASFMSEHLERAVELLSDILFNSTFNENELEKEKEVIIDEIHSFEDTPYEQIFDDFEELVFKNHPLGFNILGSEKSVKSIDRKKILNFINKNYTAKEIVFSVIGNIEVKKIKKFAEKYIEGYITKNYQKNRTAFKSYTSFTKENTKDHNQSHTIIGNIAYHSHHKKKPGFILLNNILGGPSMNSRLNMTIREKYGYAYSIESSYTSYSDTGLFSVYVGTDKKNIQKSIDLIRKELKKFRLTQLSSIQLHRAKQQLLGQIVLADENNVNVMLGIAKSLINYGKVDSLEEVYKKINRITATELIDISNEIFDEKQLSTLIFTQH